MKFIASILIISMSILGLNRFAEGIGFGSTLSETEMACSMDCCDQDQECCGHGSSDEQDNQEGRDHQCPHDCDCSYEFQLVAIEYHFMTSFVMAPKAVQYGNYTDTYHFEYFKPLFQPPRFG